MEATDIPFIDAPKDNEKDDSTTTIKSIVKGRFTKMLQDKDDTIKHLINNIVNTNTLLLQTNKELSLNNNVERSVSAIHKDNRCKELDAMLAEINSLKEFAKSLITQEVEGLHNHHPGLAGVAQTQSKMQELLGNAVEQPSYTQKEKDEIRRNIQEQTAQAKLINEMMDKMNQMIDKQREQEIHIPLQNIDPTYESKEEFAKSHDGFPPSSVEQALGNYKGVANLDKMDDATKQFMRAMLGSIISNPVIFDKMVKGESLFPSPPMKPTTSPSSLQQPKNKDETVTIQNDNPLGKLVNRIEQHDNEMKEQEINDFLNSDINLS